MSELEAKKQQFVRLFTEFVNGLEEDFKNKTLYPEDLEPELSKLAALLGISKESEAPAALDLTTYLYQVGDEDSDDISAVAASSPEEAMGKAKDERPDWKIDGAIHIYTCTKHWPKVDVGWTMDYYGECNPDESPRDGWPEWLGKETVEAIQSDVNASIKKHCPPMLMLDECLLTCTHDESEEDTEDDHKQEAQS